MDRPLYYRRDGTPMDIDEWCKEFEKERHVAETVLPWGGYVSTVWLGLEHNFVFGRPLIFESMVFESKGNFNELDVARYPTEVDAIIGHARLVKKWTHKKLKK